MTRKSEVKFPINFFGVEELGRAIKKARKLRGLTQHELAMRTNTSTKFISNVENGKDSAHIGKVLLLLRVLDMGTRLTDLRTDNEIWDNFQEALERPVQDKPALGKLLSEPGVLD